VCVDDAKGLFHSVSQLQAANTALVWPLTPDCPNNYENGKFMLPLGTLVE
jgi:hypothetical protein